MLSESRAWAYLRRNRLRMERDLADTARRHRISAATYAQHSAIMAMLNQLVAGSVIDLGCGAKPYADAVSSRATRYDTLDLYPRGDVTYIADIQDMSIVPSCTYDCAICLEVLEHVPDPDRAMREIFRILRPGGCVLISVPHLSRLHEEPNDYHRFTKYGVEKLLENAGLEVLEIRTRGGLFSFLGHQVSSLALTLVWPIWGVRHVVWFLNRVVLVSGCLLLDRIGSTSRVLPLGYVAVGMKKDDGQTRVDGACRPLGDG